MAKRFFYDKVYNLARIVFNITLVIIAIAGVIIAFSAVSNYELIDKRENYGIKNNVTVKNGTEIEKRLFFDYNFSEYSEKAEVIFPYGFDKNKAGTYEITINIDGYSFKTNLIIENL